MTTARRRETLIKNLSTFILVLLLFLRQPLKSRFRVAQFLSFGILYNFTDVLFWLMFIVRFYNELTIKYPSVSQFIFAGISAPMSFHVVQNYIGPACNIYFYVELWGYMYQVVKHIIYYVHFRDCERLLCAQHASLSDAA